MRARRLLRGLVIGLSLLAAADATAQDSQLKKADKALAAFAAGDPAGLDLARAALEAASAHGKTEGRPETWIRRGHVYRLYALQPELPGAPADPVAEMNRSFEEALARSPSEPDRAVAIGDLRAVVSAVSTRLFNDVEAGLWQEAYGKLPGALESRRLLAAYGVDEPAEQVRLLRLAVLVSAYTEHFDDAAAHHATFLAAGEFDPTVAVQLAKKLAAKRGGDDALAFLRPVGAAHPGDSTVLTTEVELLLEAGQVPDALARLDEAAAALGEGVGAQLMLGALYLRAGAEERARTAYGKALARDPNVQEALVPMARFLLADAASAEATLADDAARPTRDEKAALEARRDEAYTQAVSLLEKRRAAAADDREALQLLLTAYEGSGDEAAAKRVQEALESAP